MFYIYIWLGVYMYKYKFEKNVLKMVLNMRVVNNVCVFDIIVLNII